MRHYDVRDILAIAGGLIMVGVLCAGVVVSTRLAGVAERNVEAIIGPCDCACKNRLDPERPQ